MWNIPRESKETGKLQQDRKCTDVCALVIMLIFFLAIIGMMASTSVMYGDINRMIYGYDNCGNVCGKTNKAIRGIDCSGEDMTKKKYLLAAKLNDKDMVKICVNQCPFGTDFGNRCKENDEDDFLSIFQMIFHSIYRFLLEFIGMCCVALFLSVVMLLLLRYFTCFTIVVEIVIGFLVLGALTGLCWYWYATGPQNNQMLYIAIVFSIAFVLGLFFVFFFITKIKLVIQLFKEAGKAIGAMPCILFEPLITLLALIIAIAGCMLFNFIAADAGELKLIEGENRYDFVETPLVKYTTIIAGLGQLWLLTFILDCQTMVICGAVVRWYFTRDKSKLGKPVCRSCYVLCRFHMGTVAVGSFIVTLFTLLRSLINQAAEKTTGNATTQCLEILDSVLQKLEEVLKYLCRNTYIVTAIYGWNFFKSAVRVFHVIKDNFFAIMAINTIGDYVLWFTKLFIVVSTLIPSLWVFKLVNSNNLDGLFPFLLVCLFALCFAHMFMTVYEMTIDTLFVCFCEDQEENNGSTSPYYMSPDFYKFIEDSHKQVWTIPTNNA